jgi:hypothetical protein
MLHAPPETLGFGCAAERDSNCFLKLIREG